MNINGILSSQIGAFEDVEKAKASRNIRRGKGKMRNRRYVARKGPLVVLGPNDESGKAFRNLPGVEVAHVDRLNLLQARRLPRACLIGCCVAGGLPSCALPIPHDAAHAKACLQS